MTDERMDHRATNHATQTLLIPWFVNGTLGEGQRAALERHLGECAACRADLAMEREVHASMTAQTPIAYIPAVSLNRLRSRLDEQTGESAPRTHETGMRSPRWPAALAASVAVLAVVIGLLVVDRHDEATRMAAARYHTVTSPRQTVPDEAIRAVFAPGITLGDLQALLAEAQLQIVAGPTEAGVYSLASTTSRPVDASLSVLRHHSAVRFAESTQSDPVRGGTR